VPRLVANKVGFTLVGLLYVLAFPYHLSMRSANEVCRLWQARAIVDFHALSINEVMRQRGPATDLSCTATVEVGGVRTLRPCVGPDAPREGVVAVHYYPAKAPLLSVAGAGVYWALELLQPEVSELLQVLVSRLALTILPTLALLWALRRFLAAHVSAGVADLATVAYALGTLALNYAETFMSHQLTAVLLFGAFACAWEVERGAWRERGYVLAGLLAGATVAAEYTGALGVLCVAGYVVASRWGRWPALARAAGLVVAGAAAPLGLLMAYHAACYGGPLVSGYAFLNDAAYTGWHQGGFLGIKLPLLDALAHSLFSPLRGLFALSPLFLVVPWGLAPLRAASRPLFVLLVLLIAGNLYFTASFSHVSWGWTPGPRHLTPMLPFLMLPLALALERQLAAPSSLGRSITLGLMASSMAATGLVSFVNYVPDDVSTSLWGLAIPLLREGVLPVSWLAAVWPNPGSGAFLVALLTLAVLWFLGVAVGRHRAVPTVMAAVLFVHFSALLLATRNDDHDVAARAFLKKVWGAPDAQRLRF
jgi:hypothetical protein